MTDDLLDRLPELERQAEECERQARALRQIIEGVRALNGDAAHVLGLPSETGRNQYTPAAGPRGRSAVREIVSERPGDWKLKAIKSEVRQRGWPSSPEAVDTAVKRMHADGEAVRVGHGIYRFVGRGEADVQADTLINLQRKEGEA